jgi:hypothetical protein
MLCVVGSGSGGGSLNIFVNDCKVVDASVQCRCVGQH